MKDMIDSLPGASKLKMPGFVIAWSIVDIVLVSIRLLELPFLMISLFFCSSNILLAIFIMEIVAVIPQGALGLSGNISMLCKRRPAMGLCQSNVAVTIVSFAVLIWQLLIFRPLISSPIVYVIIVAGVVLFLMMRITLLIFYILSLRKAAAFFSERDGF